MTWQSRIEIERSAMAVGHVSAVLSATLILTNEQFYSYQGCLRYSFVEAKGIFFPFSNIQWNLDKTKGQGTGKTRSLLRGFVTSRFFFIYILLLLV